MHPPRLRDDGETLPLGSEVSAAIVRLIRRALGIVVVVASMTVGSVSAATLDDGKPKIATTKGAQAWAHRIVLKLGDFPSGWRAEPDKSDDNSSKCFRRDLLSLTVNGRAESPTSSIGELPLSSSLAAVSRASGRRPQGRRSPHSAELFDECLVSEFDKDGLRRLVRWAVELSAPRRAGGSAFQVASHVKQGKLSVAFYVDVVVIQRTRAIALGLFADAFTPFDEGLERRLARAMAQRMKLGLDRAAEVP